MKSTLSTISYCCSRWRMCFASLATLATIVAIPFLLGAGSSQPAIAIALFQVDFSPHSIRGDGDVNIAVQSFDVFKKTQLAKLKSYYVLTAALRNPSVAGLSILANEKDPVEWLDQHLTVDFPQDGEVLRLTLSANGPPEQIVTILNAAAKAYQDEVVMAERQQHLSIRDLQHRNLNDLNREIKEKLNTYLDIARESDHAVSEDDIQLKTILRKFDRIDAEILRIESAEALSTTRDTGEHAKNVQEWLAQLRKRQADLGKEISDRALRVADLELRKDEIEQLQRVANDMSLKLEQLEVELSGSERIRLLQPAVLSAK